MIKQTEYTKYNDVDESTNKYFASIQPYIKKYDVIDEETIEMTEENRDIFIYKNIKQVITIANKYRGMGIDFLGLISAGNIGLIQSWEKYDKSRAKLSDIIIDRINKYYINYDNINFDELTKILNDVITYGDDYLNKIIKKLDKFYKKNNDNPTKDDILNYIKKSIKNAKFSSVCYNWIRSAIITELKQNQIVKKSDKDRIGDGGSYRYTVSIDEANNENDNSDIIACYNIDDFTATIDNYDFMIEEDHKDFVAVFKNILSCLEVRSRCIIFKRFGLGLPRPMTIKEIADTENLTTARVSQIILESYNMLTDFLKENPKLSKKMKIFLENNNINF